MEKIDATLETKIDLKAVLDALKVFANFANFAAKDIRAALSARTALAEHADIGNVLDALDDRAVCSVRVVCAALNVLKALNTSPPESPSMLVHIDTLWAAGLASQDTATQDAAANGILSALEALDENENRKESK